MDGEEPSGASVYRFYAADQLVYLGVTGGLPRRLDAHAGRDWWRTCDRLTLVHYATREEAETAEVEGIRAEHPAYNIVHNHHLPPMAGREETDMDVYTSRAFQIAYQRLEEPVVVYAKSRKLGTWYPKGTEPSEPEEALPQVDPRTAGLEEEIRHLKQQLAARQESEHGLIAQRDEAVENVHVIRRKIEGAAVVSKPASNVRAAERPDFVPYSARPLTPVPKVKK